MSTCYAPDAPSQVRTQQRRSLENVSALRVHAHRWVTGLFWGAEQPDNAWNRWPCAFPTPQKTPLRFTP